MNVTALSVLWQLDPSPEPNDVVAGWGAFGLFGLGILVVALLGWSLVRQLRKVDAAEEAGLYDPTDRRPRENVRERGSRTGAGVRAEQSREEPPGAGPRGTDRGDGPTPSA